MTPIVVRSGLRLRVIPEAVLQFFTFPTESRQKWPRRLPHSPTTAFIRIISNQCVLVWGFSFQMSRFDSRATSLSNFYGVDPAVRTDHFFASLTVRCHNVLSNGSKIPESEPQGMWQTSRCLTLDSLNSVWTSIHSKLLKPVSMMTRVQQEAVDLLLEN